MGVYVSPPSTSFLESSVIGEVPSGAIDGVNRAFLTARKFIMEFGGPQIAVYLNGTRQQLPDDYSVSESVPGSGFDTIVFALPPLPGDNIAADYIADII